MLRRSRRNPRRLVELVDSWTLIDAYCGDALFGLRLDEGCIRFVCPTCGHADHNGGTASMADEWRWSCFRSSCRASGTRMRIERAVLEDDRMLDRLYDLLEAGADG